MARWKDTFYALANFTRHSAMHWSQTVLDIGLPRHSILDGLPLQRQSASASENIEISAEMELWNHLVFLDEPRCSCCGYPFEYVPLFLSQEDRGLNEGADGIEDVPSFVQQAGAYPQNHDIHNYDLMQCGACIARPPVYDGGRAALVYDDTSRKMMLDFKYGGRTDGVAFFAAQLSRAGRDLLAVSDIILPVPLHAARLRTRRFNQAAILARAVSKLTNIPYDTNSLLRHQNTISQGAQNFIGRKKNVSKAFHIPHKKRKLIEGKNCLIIDDVWTSGATLSACAKTLKQAGAGQVYILALMRVVRPVTLPT